MLVVFRVGDFDCEVVRIASAGMSRTGISAISTHPAAAAVLLPDVLLQHEASLDDVDLLGFVVLAFPQRELPAARGTLLIRLLEIMLHSLNGQVRLRGWAMAHLGLLLSRCRRAAAPFVDGERVVSSFVRFSSSSSSQARSATAPRTSPLSDRFSRSNSSVFFRQPLVLLREHQRLSPQFARCSFRPRGTAPTRSMSALVVPRPARICRARAATPSFPSPVIHTTSDHQVIPQSHYAVVSLEAPYHVYDTSCLARRERICIHRSRIVSITGSHSSTASGATG